MAEPKEENDLSYGTHLQTTYGKHLPITYGMEFFLKNPLKYLNVSEFISRDFLNKNFLASIYFKCGSLYRSHTQKESSKQWLHICKPLLNGGDI